MSYTSRVGSEHVYFIPFGESQQIAVGCGHVHVDISYHASQLYRRLSHVHLPAQAASCIFAVFAQRDCSGSSWGGDSDNRIPSYEDCVVSDSMLLARFTRFPPRASILTASLSFFAFPSACASL